MKQTTERTKRSDDLKFEIETLSVSLTTADAETDDRQAEIAKLEHEREELFVEECLGAAGARKKIDKLSARIEALASAPDKKIVLRRALNERHVELARTRRRERAVEAAERAKKLLPAIARIENALLEAGADLGLIFAELNQVYAAAADAKTVGPSTTPRQVTYESVRRAFGAILRPLLEGPDTKSPTPLQDFLRRVIERGETR